MVSNLFGGADSKEYKDVAKEVQQELQRQNMLPGSKEYDQAFQQTLIAKIAGPAFQPGNTEYKKRLFGLGQQGLMGVQVGNALDTKNRVTTDSRGRTTQQTTSVGSSFNPFPMGGY